MKSKFLAWVSAVSAVALVSGILIVSANAHIGASHSPISTTGPDLVSATADGTDVQVCFDEEVSDVDDTGGLFNIVDYDSANNTAGDSADLGAADECVDVSFPIDRDSETFTVIEVENGAVEDRGGDENSRNSVEITGSIATGGDGKTVEPDLVSFDERTNDVRFNFDEELDCDDAEANDTSFYAFDRDGNNDDGDVAECDGDHVDVTFTGVDTSQIENVSVESNNLGVDNCGVHADDPFSNCSILEAVSGDVQDFPDLEDVERTDDDELTFSFDEDLDDTVALDPTDWYWYEEDGDLPDNANDCDYDEDNTVQCQWDEDSIQDSQDSELPLGSVDYCAVESEITNDCNPPGSGGVGTSSEDTGLTDGPDLEEVRKVTDALADFIFDETVDEDGVVDGNNTAFNVVDGEGRESAGTDIDDVNDNVVTVEFDEDDLAEAIGGDVEFGAADDFLDNESVDAAAGIGTAGSSGGTSPGGTATTTSSTTTTVTTGR